VPTVANELASATPPSILAGFLLVRIGKGCRRAEAERLAFAVHQVAKTMWMGRGPIRVRLRDGILEFKGEWPKCAQAIGGLWYGCSMLSARD
jgi:hypothetical protein